MIWLRISLAFLYLELSYAFDPIVHRNNTQFTWMTGRWESCISDHCGDGGRQLRQIWCVRERGEADLSSKCDPQHKPAEVRSCFKVCDEHRDLLEWRPEPWQACEPLNDESSTSPDCNILGTRLRNITCHWKETGKILDESLCSYFTPQPNIKEVCKVPCQQECIVTEYGSWSKCSKCGHRVRLRSVIVAPSSEMEPCLPLSEIEFCGPNTCLENIAHNYSLYLSTWGYCNPLKPVDYHEAEDYVHKAIIGIQKRNISCKNGEGINVDMQHCLQNNKISPSLEEVCVVLQKCQTSMWSPWQVINET